MKKLIQITIILLLYVAVFLISFNNTKSGSTTTSGAPDTAPIIIIDAGHGGFDGGASTEGGVPEKDINLSISLYLRDFLKLFGFRTVLTRETDASVEDEGLSTIRQKKKSDIHNRMSLMEKYDNCVFLSIHQNFFKEEKYSGLQVFYSKNFSETSSALAGKIQSEAVNLLQPQNTRKIKECGTSVYLIYNAKAPACLIECGFLSNKQEAQKLLTEEYQKQVAYCIAVAVYDYYKIKD